MDSESCKKITRQLIDEGQCVDIKATGLSMFPTFWPKYVHRVKKCTPSELRKGDIAVFQSKNGKWIVHRVIENTGTTIICRGDSILYNDAPADYANIVGEVIATRVFGIRFGVKWWGARFYSKLLLACHPVSTAINHAFAWNVNLLWRVIRKIFR